MYNYFIYYFVPRHALLKLFEIIGMNVKFLKKYYK